MKVDFIVCWDDQTWSTEHVNVPDKIVASGNDAMVQWYQDNIIEKLPEGSGKVSANMVDFIYPEDDERAYKAIVQVTLVYEKQFYADSETDAQTAVMADLAAHPLTIGEENGWWEDVDRYSAQFLAVHKVG